MKQSIKCKENCPKLTFLHCLQYGSFSQAIHSFRFLILRPVTSSYLILWVILWWRIPISTRRLIPPWWLVPISAARVIHARRLVPISAARVIQPWWLVPISAARVIHARWLVPVSAARVIQAWRLIPVSAARRLIPTSSASWWKSAAPDQRWRY